MVLGGTPSVYLAEGMCGTSHVLSPNESSVLELIKQHKQDREGSSVVGSQLLKMVTFNILMPWVLRVWHKH